MGTVSQLGFENANAAVGIALKQYLFECGITNTQLADAFGIKQSVMSRKMRGQIGWSAADTVMAAAFLGLEPNDIMPTMHINNGKVYWQPAPYKPGYAHPRTDLLCPRKDSNLRPTA